MQAYRPGLCRHLALNLFLALASIDLPAGGHLLHYHGAVQAGKLDMITNPVGVGIWLAGCAEPSVLGSGEAGCMLTNSMAC